jgi:hypothetical protein
MPNKKQPKRKGKQKQREVEVDAEQMQREVEVDSEQMQGEVEVDAEQMQEGCEIVGGGIEGRTPEPLIEAKRVNAPFIYDPGNGLRVRDVRVFLRSPFAQPVAQEDPLCQEIAKQEVLDILMTRLPEEPALVGHYI